MTQPKRQKKTQSLSIAEDLHKHHTTAEIAFKNNPKEIVYTEAVVIKLLTKHGLPAPDFERYSKIAKDSNEGYMNIKRELLHITHLIKQGMKKKGLDNSKLAELMNLSKPEITRLLSGVNMTAATMVKLQRVLEIKLINH